jgi:hypothetical protein
MTDSILGPFADAAFARRITRGKERRDPKFLNVQLDERLLKHKITAFIAVCGSNYHIPDHWTMALPTMHLFAFPLHAKVVDQFVAPGCNYSGAIVLNNEAHIKRAQKLGHNVASQIGKEFDVAQYLSDEEGAFPCCHQLKFEFPSGTTFAALLVVRGGAWKSNKEGTFGHVGRVIQKSASSHSLRRTSTSLTSFMRWLSPNPRCWPKKPKRRANTGKISRSIWRRYPVIYVKAKEGEIVCLITKSSTET